MTVYDLWEKVFPPEKRWLGIILFVSLIGHLTAFFVFQIQPLDASSPLERPHRLVWISGQSLEEGRLDSDPLAWIRWRDPSAIALPQAEVPTPPSLKETLEQPGQRALPPLSLFNPLEEKEVQSVSLRSRVMDSIRRPEVRSMPLATEAPPKLSGTVVVLRRNLEGRDVVRKVELPRPTISESLRATVYYLEVTAAGVVLNVRIESSSGNSEIDRIGAGILRQWRFAPVEDPVESTWGRIEVFWDYREPNPDQVEFRF